MEKIIRIIVCVAILAPMALSIQSFRMSEPPPPAPSQTLISVSGIPSGVAVRVSICGYLYTDPLHWKCTPMDDNNPSSSEIFETGEKYLHTEDDSGSIGFWTYSGSNWSHIGSLDVYDHTSLYGDGWIQTITCTFPSPPPE